MHACLAVQNKTVSGQGRDQLTSRQAAQVREIDRHTSDDYCYLRLAGHLHPIGGLGRQGLAVLHQAFYDHLDHFLDVLDCFLFGMAPRGAALPHQRRTVCVPALAVRLYHDPERVGLHLPRLCSVCHIPVQQRSRRESLFASGGSATPTMRARWCAIELPNVNQEMSFLEMLDVLNEDLIAKNEEPVAFDHDCREGTGTEISSAPV